MTTEATRAGPTPGPWRYRIADSGNPAGIQIYSISGQPVASIPKVRNFDHVDPIKEANARLIAAAPRMADYIRLHVDHDPEARAILREAGVL